MPRRALTISVIAALCTGVADGSLAWRWSQGD